MVRIFVGNLSFGTSDAGLCLAFSTFGSVTSARVARDANSGGRSQGYGFVEMPDEDQAAEAVAEMDGSMLDGERVQVRIIITGPSRRAQPAV